MRLIDRRAAGAILVGGLWGAGAFAAACANDDPVRFEDTDAGAGRDAAPRGDIVDANADVPVITTDAGAFDAAVREVNCESAGCAVALTPVLARSQFNFTEPNGQAFCVLLHDGTVACWGANVEGQLGRGIDAGSAASATPERIAGLSNVVSLNGPCAVESDGSAWCWGTGPYLQSDAAAVTTEFAPVKLPIPPATLVATSGDDGCAIVDGKTQCWGRNTFVQIPTPSGDYHPEGLPPTEMPVPTGAAAQDLLVAKASFIRRADGTVLSWGFNPPLGRVTSLSPDPNPDPIALKDVTAISVARVNACAVANGVPYCWGTIPPLPGNVPDERNLDHALPEAVFTPERVVQISTTDDFVNIDVPLPRRWCAVGGSGAVYCWGNNANGQAGDGTKDYVNSAVKVPLPVPAVHVETTADTTCALLVNGKVYCWGGDFYGQLGHGKLKQQSLVPVEVLLP
ncbi:hypothetical protein AKJ09_01354 [Labilithrix luteola]|uniref:BNR repeat domain protein n=1 Tax=Labilithrix luteola TaxID=1391654 RepID=A0A0K1PMD5_9BACT|nr:hypothetical protein AKJ09_01354 [Labilithrix luteola]